MNLIYEFSITKNKWKHVTVCNFAFTREKQASENKFNM